jgi:hypothetical protein
VTGYQLKWHLLYLIFTFRFLSDLILIFVSGSQKKGRIRNFPSSATKEYQRAFQNFRYLLAALQLEDPEVYHYLKRHVKMGAEPAWVDTGEDGPMAQD